MTCCGVCTLDTVGLPNLLPTCLPRQPHQERAGMRAWGFKSGKLPTPPRQQLCPEYSARVRISFAVQ